MYVRRMSCRQKKTYMANMAMPSDRVICQPEAAIVTMTRKTMAIRIESETTMPPPLSTQIGHARARGEERQAHDDDGDLQQRAERGRAFDHGVRERADPDDGHAERQPAE